MPSFFRRDSSRSKPGQQERDPPKAATTRDDSHLLQPSHDQRYHQNGGHQSTSNTPSISRSGSIYSFRSERQVRKSSVQPPPPVAASDLLASFPSRKRVPSSRRLSSFVRSNSDDGHQHHHFSSVDRTSTSRDHSPGPSLSSPRTTTTTTTARATSLHPQHVVSSGGRSSDTSHLLHSPTSTSSPTSFTLPVVPEKGKMRAATATATASASTHGAPILNEVAGRQQGEAVKEDEEDDDEGEDAFASADEFDGQGEEAVAGASTRDAVAPATTAAYPAATSSPSTIDFARPDPTESPLRADIRQIWYAISLFLNSRMKEAEAICMQHKEDRLYYILGHSLLESIKSLMTFEPEDMGHAIELCKECLSMASKEKHKTSPGAKSASWSERLTGSLGGVVKGSSLTTESIARMSVEQRHAELAYAECLLIKALLGIIYAGDFLAFLKESLNMRSSHATYKALSTFIANQDAKAPGGRDESIDRDFRSGVEYGCGSSSLILSLLPSSAIKVMAVFGFSANRQEALKTLMSTGGWVAGKCEPQVKEGPGIEGLRRCVCDLTLLMYHLVIATFLPVSDVDIDLADSILHYNLRRYPNGVFFLYFSGRLYATQTMTRKAVEQYHKAIDSQKEYRQIQHIIHWDLSLTHMALAEWSEAHECLSILDKESKWSKAIYSYGKAVTSYEDLLAKEAAGGVTEEVRKAVKLNIENNMKSVPGYLQKIAGKSLPFEKFVARKSKKFLAQGGRLCLAGVELTYMQNGLVMSPRYTLIGKHLKQINETLAALELQRNDKPLPDGWWDDFCMAHFLRAVVLQFIVRPEPYAKPDPPESPISIEEADELSAASFETILSNSMKLELEHHLAWFAHFEYARMLMRKGGPSNYELCKQHLDKVLEGKVVLGPTKGKGKVSMQNMAVIRANSTMELLKQKMATG